MHGFHRPPKNDPKFHPMSTTSVFLSTHSKNVQPSISSRSFTRTFTYHRKSETSFRYLYFSCTAYFTRLHTRRVSSITAFQIVGVYSSDDVYCIENTCLFFSFHNRYIRNFTLVHSLGNMDDE